MTAKGPQTGAVRLADRQAVVSREAPPPQTEPGPVEAVKSFYAAVSDGDCAAAARIRPGYSEAGCRAISNVRVVESKEEYNDGCAAVVRLQVTYTRDGKAESFVGLIKLEKRGGRWIIVNGSYDSKAGLASYKKKYVEGQTVPGCTPAGASDQGSLDWEIRTAGGDSASAAFSGILTFGSQAVLDSCWDPSRLGGRPEEREIVKLGHPDPPFNAGRKTPLHQPNPHPLPPDRRGSIRYVNPNDKARVIALTFDLCEMPGEKAGYDGAVIDYLRAHRVKATLFMGGKWMRSHPDRAKQLIADPLFEIGNHTWTHSNLRVVPYEKMADQVLFTQVQYEILREELANSECARRAGPEAVNLIPLVPLTLRFPYGACNPQALDFLADQGLPAIQWSIVTGDPAKNQTPEGIAAIVLEKAGPGAIVIGHANGRGRGAAGSLPLYVPKLREKGYEFVTVTELLSLGVPYATDECYEQKPGDNARYDEIFKD
jgi:peptidoglycan/xylan/chitin deacetylase (PgdA/CDA1 family)